MLTHLGPVLKDLIFVLKMAKEMYVVWQDVSRFYMFMPFLIFFFVMRRIYLLLEETVYSQKYSPLMTWNNLRA